MGVQTRSDAVRDIDAGNLEAARTRVTRLQLGLEGTWPGIRLGSGAVTPSVELGLRRDGGDGDAETGLGIDAGAGSQPGQSQAPASPAPCTPRSPPHPRSSRIPGPRTVRIAGVGSKPDE